MGVKTASGLRSSAGNIDFVASCQRVRQIHSGILFERFWWIHSRVLIVVSMAEEL
jgi:hypothetical protein